MPNIKPVSDLRNYTSVLTEVRRGSPVYLTKNGRGCYAIVEISELEDFEKARAQLQLMRDLHIDRRARDDDGWVNSEGHQRQFEHKEP